MVALQEEVIGKQKVRQGQGKRGGQGRGWGAPVELPGGGACLGCHVRRL